MAHTHSKPPPFDLEIAHRWFAVELNNRTWNLVEAEERSADDVERMIHGAHAACFHWLQAGNQLNHLRAQSLLATAYARAGLAEAAVRHAEKCLSLSREAGDTQNAFDRATAYGAAATAYKLAGRVDDAHAAHEQSKLAAASLDADDRVVVERLYPVP